MGPYGSPKLPRGSPDPKKVVRWPLLGPLVGPLLGSFVGPEVSHIDFVLVFVAVLFRVPFFHRFLMVSRLQN